MRRHAAIPMPEAPALQASAEQIAMAMAQSTGAQWCYLAVAGNAGRRPRLLVSVGAVNELPSGTAEISALLRRTHGHGHASPVVVGGMQGLALGLHVMERQIGAALLIYADPQDIMAERAVAAADLAAAALDSARQIAKLHMQAEEIEERVRLREIQVSRNLIRGVIDSIPLGLALLDSEGTVLAVNRALAERFEIAPALLVGLAYDALIGPWAESPAAQALASGQPEQTRRTVTRADRREVLLEISAFPLLDADGRPRQVVEVWEDITERVALQQQIVRVERLAAIGQLAASIAHEVGNPLQAIQGFLVLFLEQSPPDTANRNFLELAGEEIERIVRVIDGLRDLYRPRADVMAPVDLNGLVERVLQLTGKQLERGGVTVVCDLSVALPAIQGVADQLKQVLLNLVLNATAAMPQGGVLRLQTSPTVLPDGTPGAMITIGDTGVGIPPEWLPALFDGIYTTKEHGMGLGLHTSKAIVERHMGRIEVRSQVGEGTTFTIMLPVGA